MDPREGRRVPRRRGGLRPLRAGTGCTSEIRRIDGEPLSRDDVVDFGLCCAFDFQDPWGNRFVLNCYDHDAVTRELIDAMGVTPVRSR